MGMGELPDMYNMQPGVQGLQALVMRALIHIRQIMNVHVTSVM